jgi:signal transduction histidine kinase
MASISEPRGRARPGPRDQLAARLPFEVLRGRWPEIAWWTFVALNTWGIWLFRGWATVPFHFIWISLALMYGWRMWNLRDTLITLLVVVVLTGLTLGNDVAAGYQAVDELSEIPLMSAVFGAMVLHVQRAARLQRETARVSEHNRALLEQNRRLVQNVSHNLRTPLTIALGFAEVLQRTTTDPRSAEDAQEVIDELQRLKKATDRLLRLAKSDQPDFLFRSEASVAALISQVTGRWRRTGAQAASGQVEDAVLLLDEDRIVEVLDELISNAVQHGGPGTHVLVSSHREEDWQVLVVSDDGPGIPADAAATVFERFSHPVERGHQGFGLGLAIVRAISRAHGGSARLASVPGTPGTTVEIRLPR